MNCPNCNARGWVRSASADKPIELCTSCRGRGTTDAGWRPPGWSWFLAAFIGLVVSNAIVPSAHGATLANAMTNDSSVVAALLGLGIGIVVLGVAVWVAWRGAPPDPNEPTPDQQREQAMRSTRPADLRVVCMADRRRQPAQPGDKASR